LLHIFLFINHIRNHFFSFSGVKILAHLSPPSPSSVGIFTGCAHFVEEMFVRVPTSLQSQIRKFLLLDRIAHSTYNCIYKPFITLHKFHLLYYIPWSLNSIDLTGRGPLL
jgi:hypothetical protein